MCIFNVRIYTSCTRGTRKYIDTNITYIIFLFNVNTIIIYSYILLQFNKLKIGTSLKSIASLVKASPRPLTMRFRDPSRFFEQLDSCNGKPLRVVSTSYLPANARDAGATEQIIIVERLAMPPPEERKRSSQMLDVMEIQYVMSVKGNDDGVIVDSSAERAPPGTSSKSIYYVLGQRNGPPGKYPPG